MPTSRAESSKIAKAGRGGERDQSPLSRLEEVQAGSGGVQWRSTRLLGAEEESTEKSIIFAIAVFLSDAAFIEGAIDIILSENLKKTFL